MAIVMKESSFSRRRTVNVNGEAELRFYITGSDDDQAVMDHVLANVPATWAGLPNQENRIEPKGAGAWDVISLYAPNSVSNQSTPPAPPEVGDSEYLFDTTGGTQHITQALETVATYPDPAIGVASDWKGAIGVTDDGVNGVDIIAPQMTYEETHQIAHATVVGGLVTTIYGLTAKVNNATFKGFAAGELLFAGASGRRRSSDGFWTITFKFIASRNAASLVVGPITVTVKQGWDHLDVQYESAEDATASMLVKAPVAVRIQKVYERGNFSALGI